MLKRKGLLASGRNSSSRTSRGKDKTKPGRLASAIKPVLETLETRQMLSLAAGSLDPTFGTSGQVMTSLSSEDQGNAMAVDPTSGDIFVAGTSNNQFTLVAYSPSGSLIASNSIAIGVGSSSANAVKIDASHNIWVAGVADDGVSKGNDFVLAEYTLSGSTLSPTSFGGLGYVTTDVQTGKSDTANAVVVDGSDILVAGNTGSGATQRAAVVAYNSSTGSLDTSFGGGVGKVIGSGVSESANDIAISGSGIVVAGQASSKAEILLINSSGSSVTSLFPAVGGSSDLESVVTDGSDYLLGGTADNNFVVAAVNASSGLLDPSFGTGGVTETVIGTQAQANAIAVQSNGKIDLAGSATVGSKQVFAVARYSVTGSADSAFGTSGVSLSSTFTSTNSIATGVAVEPDGKIVAAGYTGTTSDEFAVARYVANNAPTSASATASLDNVAENDDASAGTSVATLVSRFGMTDPDGDTVGLAITAAEETYGTWQYSTNGGTLWTNIPVGVSDTNALLLAPSALVRFQPVINSTGTSTISVRAWDQTHGASGSMADYTTDSSNNLNSFSDLTYTASVSVSPTSPPTIVYVDAAWTGTTNGSNVTDGFGQHTFGVDAFSTIQNGANAVASGGTVEVDAGTYAESVTISKPLNLLGAESNVGPTGRAAAFVSGKADPTVESIITAPIVDPNDATNDLLHVDASNVTINGFVIDGNNAVIADQSAATAINGVDTDSRRAIETENASGSLVTESSVVVEYNVIQNFSQRGVELANSSDTSPATSGDVVTQNVISNFGTTGVLMAFNAYGSVTHNTIGAPAGVDAGIMVQDYTDNTAVPSSLDVSNNNVTIGQDAAGIWVNLFHPTVATTLTVNSNTVNAATGVTGTDGLTFGIYLSSINTAGPVVSASGNVVGTTGGQFAAGIDLWNLPTSTPVSVSGGSVGNSSVGIQADNDDISFGAGAATTVDISGVSISGAGTGILVSGDSTGAAIAANISGATTNITGGTTGIQVDGPNASISFSGSAPANLSGLSGNYITVSGGAMNSGTPGVIDASNVSFSGSLGSALGLSSTPSAYAVEDKITDYLDDSTLGYVSLNATNVYVAQSSDLLADGGSAGSIQRGVNVVPSGDTVNVQAGIYVGANVNDLAGGFVAAVQINKPISLIGPNAAFDPTGAVPASQAILLPGSSDPTLDANESVGIEVLSSNVTIEGLTVDGSNTGLTHDGSVTFRGVPIDEAEGIISYQGVGHITVQGNIVENTDYSGVTFYNVGNGGGATSDSTISNNLIQHISDAQDGVGVLIYNNFYAQVTNNVINDVYVGVQTGNFSSPNSDSGFAPEISNNNIATRHDGLFYNLHYSGASAFTVAGNIITAVAQPAGDPVHPTNWTGIAITSQQNAVGVTLSNNSIDGTGATFSNVASGIVLWNDPTTGSIAINGGSITGVNYGVWANSFEGFASNGDAVSGTVSGVNITASAIGVYVEDSTLNTQSPRPNVSLTITGNTDISTNSVGGIGIEVSGSTASATITGNNTSITGNFVGIDIDGGSATITNNHIAQNHIGVEIDSGGSATITDNIIDNTGVSSSTGIWILAGGTATSIIGNTVENNTSSGIRVEGSATTISGDNAIDNDITGIFLNGGSVGTIDGNSFATNGLDLSIAAGGTLTSLTNNSFTGTQYISNLSPNNIDATTDTFNAGPSSAPVGGAAITLTEGFAIEDRITDALDQAGLGFVRIQNGSVFVTQQSENTNLGAIQRAVNIASSGDSIYVQAGLFHENVNITKPLSLHGAYAGTAGATASGTSPTRTASNETEVQTNGNQLAVFSIASGGVTIDGFDIEGSDGTPGATLTSGNITNVEYGIRPSGAFSNLTIENNIIRNAEIGFRGDGSASNNLITQNWFDSIGVYDFGYAVSLRTNFYANVTDNLMTEVQSGVQSNAMSGAGGPGSWLVQGNTISAYGAGVWDNLQFNGATSMTIDNNTITSLVVPNIAANVASGALANSNGHTIGILLVSIQDAVGATITNNNISGMAYGVTLYNTTTSNTVTLGATNTITGNGVGVYLTNIVQFNPVTTTVLGGSANNPTGTATANLTGLTLAGNTTGVLVNTSNPSSTDGVSLTIGSGDSITGGVAGLVVSGPQSSIAGNTLNNLLLGNISGTYITLSNGAMNSGAPNFTPGVLNASGASFDGTLGSALSLISTPTAYAVEDKIADYLDNGTLGYVKLNAANVYVTQLSEATTAGATQRGVNVAPLSGGTVDIQAGPQTYAGGVTISNPLTISGDSESGVTVVPAIGAGNSQTAFLIASSSVTIQDLTIDGLTNTSSADQFGDGVFINYTSSVFLGINPIVYNDVIAQNLTVENVSQRGIEFKNQGTGYQIVDNTLTNSGIQAVTAIGGNTLITGNIISDTNPNFDDGIAVNALYDSSNAFAPLVTIQGNQISGINNGIYVSAMAAGSLIGGTTPAQANIIDSTNAGAGAWGIVISFSQGAATIEGNTLTSAPDADGILLFEDDLGQIQLTNNQITTIGTSTNGIGIYETDNNSVFGEPSTGGSFASIQSNIITGFKTGIEVESINGGAGQVTATIGGTGPGVSNTINGASGSTGILVTGLGASATISNNNTTIENNTIGIDVEGGTATIDDNVFSGNGTDLKIGSSGSVTSLTGNAFSGTQFIDDGTVGDTLNATTDTFSDAATSNLPIAGNALTLSQAFAVEDQISDYLDNPANGYVELNATNVYVSQVSDNTTNDAVQRGVNVSAAGGTVNVQAGTFIGQVEIPTNLTLVGSGQASTIIQAPASLPLGFTTTYNGAVNHPVVYVHNAAASIEDLTVDGNGQGGNGGGNANYKITGIGYYDAAGTIDHVTVEHVRETPLDGDQQGVGIFVQNDDSVARTVNITNSDIFDYQKGGIVMNGAGLSGSITGNTVTGAATLGINGQNGIQISRGAVAEVSGDAVGGNLYDGNTAAGILLFQAGAGVQVTGNTLTGNDIGLSSDGSTNAVLSGNTLSGNTDAIQLDDDATGSTIQNNLISSNTGTGVYIDGSVTDSSAPLTVNNNSISGNATAGLDNESAITVNATSNWWGSANGPQAPSNSFNVGHQGDKITGPGTTTFAPWLASGANNPPAPPGFYPTAGVSFAPIHNSEGQQFGSIQAAVNGSPAGDTITVAAGMYIENVTVPHNLTIDGGGHTSDPTASSVVESATNGPVFEISGGTVTLENFYITAGSHGKTAGVQVDAGAGVIISHVAINDPAVGLTVAAGASATVDDSTISNNLTGIISSGTLTVDDGSVISSNSVTGVELDGGSANLTGSTITDNPVGLWLEGNNITASGGVQNDAETDIDCKITGSNDTAQNMEMDTALTSVTNSGTNNRLLDDTITGSITGVEVQAGGSLELDGVSISGATIGVQIDATASATIKDDGTNPTVISNGGEGILDNGNFTTQSTLPRNGIALQVYGMTAGGGHKGYGIEIGSGGSAEISNTELGIGSQASENGNSLVMDSGAGTVSVTGTSITDSTVAGVDVEGGTLSITGSTISNPDLTSTSTGTLMFEGTGMIINGGSVTVLSTTISDTNVAVDESGAHTGVLIGNHKDVDADTFSDNTTGISVESGSLQVDDVNFQDNLTDMVVGNPNGSPTDPVTATASIVDSKNISDGAAKGQATDGIIADNGGSITLSGSSFSDYTDDAVQINGGIATIDGNNQFTNNNVGIAVKKQGSPSSGATGHAIVIGDSTNGGNGFSGNTTAVQIDDGDVTLTGNIFTNNVTAADVDGDGQADFTGNNFTDNTTGVIANSSITVDSSNDTFTYDANETASSVVGLRVTSTGSADVSAVLYVRKQGSDQNSIAIESNGGLTVENGTQIAGFSKGIQIAGGTAIIENSTIGAITVSPNNVPGNAVGLEATGGTVTVQNNTFDDNTVSGIDIETGGSVIVNGGTFQNTALESTTGGTLVYNGDGIDDNSAAPNSLAFNGGTITNTAVGMRYRPGNNKTTRIKITREWSNDTIASNGIGVEIDGGGADIGDATVSGDLTTGGANFSNNGTAVLVDGDAQVNLIDNTITGGIGQIGIDDSSSQAVDSTGDTISGSSGDNLLVGQRMHKPFSTTVLDVTSGDTISDANTGIEIDGSGLANLVGNTLTNNSVGINDQSTGTVTSTGDTISNAGTGVVVGASASAIITNADISNGGTGIQSSGSVTVKKGKVIGMTSGGGNKGYGIEIDGGNATIGGSNAGDGVDIESNVAGIDADANGGLDRLSIIGNTISNNTTGVLIENGAGVDLSGNTINISADQIGIDDQSTGSVTSTDDVLDGTQSHDAQTTAVRVGRRGSMSLSADELGFIVTGIDDDGTIHITNTTVSNATTGVTAESDATSVRIDGGSSLSDDTTGIEIAGGTVTVDHTAISGSTTGVLVDAGQSVTIQNSSTISGATTGVDIEGGTATIDNSTISDSTDGVHNDSETGVSSVFLNGSTLSDNATGITLSGGGDDSATLDSASKIILPTGGVGVLMTDDSNSTATNTITGGTISDDTNNGGATNTVGIEVTDNLGKKHNYIGHVTIVKPTIGVEVYGEATFTDDTITNNDIGVIVESTGNATIGTGGFGNDISDNTTTGIEFTAGSSGSVSNNFIQGNGTGVLFDSGFTGSMTVVDNNISGNTTAGLDNASSASINADLNYWGTSNGPTISSNPGGTGDVILGSNVTYLPWLTNGTDSDADRTDGFQPEPGDTEPSNLMLNLSASKINEDGITNLSGSFTDTGSADTHTVDINWGDGSSDTILTLPATTLSFSNIAHQYLDNPTGQPDGSFTISVTVTDTDGASTAANTSVEVDNVAPAVAITGAPSSAGVAAGPALVLGSTIADPSPIDQAALFTYVWSVTLNGNAYTTNLSGTSGNITPTGTAGPSLTFTSTPLFGNYVVTLIVTDKDGGQTTTSSSFRINEATPAMTLSGSQTDPTNSTPNDAEGSTFTLTLSPLQESDLIHGGDTVDSYTILWGDGSTNITGAQLANLVANGGTVTHVYEDGLTAESSTPNTTIQVIVDITDGFGTEHAFSPATGGSLPIDVYNVAPTAQLTGTSSVSEGSSGFVQFLNQSDPSPVDAAAGFTYEYDFNNSGNFSAPTTNNFATVPASVLATPGTDTVAARIYDKDGGFTTDTFQITVTNVAPTVNTIPNITNQPQNSAFHVNGTFTDPGSDSPWVVFVNYDSTHVAGIGSQIQSGPSKSFSLSNAYATPGVYTVLVTVEDLGGPSNNSLSLSGSTTFTVTVTATTFQVTQFTQTPSGFDVTFNRAVNTAALRLYGSTLVGGGGTTSDLTITGQNTGPVKGSVVWDPTTNTAHFIKTGGPLVDDVYSVTLLSGPNGWKDTSGNQLDGLDNGGTSNYTNTITVNAPTNEPVVSIPDFARGPGQSINVTPQPTANTTALGLPISIFNATNIVSVDFDLVYNPALLSITGATKAAGLPSNWGLTVNQVSPSQFNFTISGITPISGSMLSLIILTAKVPNTAPYAAAADLQLTNLVVSQQSVGTIPSLADSTMQKVAYLGDSDGDGTLTGNDAGLISRVVVHLDTGFDAYPLTDPTLIGDVSNDGVITGFDASEDLAASVGFSEPTIPNIPNIGTLVTGGIDPNVSIGSNIVASGGTTVVPINIDDLTDVNGLTVTVGFNSSLVQLSDGSDVTVSNALSPYFTAIYNPANGKIGIEENNPPANGLTGPATLVNMTFTVPANSNPGVDSVTVTGPASVGTGATKLNYTYTNGSIVIPPTFTGNNQFIVALDGSGNVDVWQDVPETSTPTYVFAQSLLNTSGFSVLSFTTTQSGGSLTIDDKNGNPLPSGGVTYNATGTGNSLIIDANNAGGDAVTVGSSSETLDGDALSLSNVQNFVFNGGTANDTLTQTSQPTASLTFNGGGGADILNVNGGSYTLSGSENPAESLTVNVNNAGSAVTFGSSYTLAALNIGNGASAQIALSSSTPSVLVTSALSILGTGKLDMTNNELIFHSSAANRVGDLAALTSLLASGASFNNIATYWAGSGIDSSSAASDHNFITGVGIMLNDAGNLATLGPTYTTTFGGQTVSNTDILVRYTYYGDADLNGTVNATDYTLVDNGFNMGLTGWVNGDFNYDQSINGDDYTLMDNAFNTQSANQIEVLAVNAEQVATPAPSVAAAVVSATTKASAAANTVAASGSSTADDTTDLKKKHRSIYNLVEDSDQSNS